MKKCNNCNIEYEDNKMYCEKCGNKLIFFETGSDIEEDNGQAGTKKDKRKIVLTLLCLLEAVSLVISIMLCIYFENECDYQSSRKIAYMYDYDELKEECSTLKEECNALKEERDALKEDYNELEDDYNFYYEYATMIDVTNNSDDGYYHRRDCKNCEFDNFYIYNIDYAKSKGYKPCPECWAD